MDKAYFAGNALFVGIISIVCGFYFFAPIIFVTKSSLTPIKGKITNVKTFYTEVESRTSKTIKSELKFTLDKANNVFGLTKNIGHNRYNETFENLAKQLNDSENVTVWIKESQLDKFKPIVFQISDRSGKTIYSLTESRQDTIEAFISTIILGLVGIGIFIAHKFWSKASAQHRL